MCATKVIFFVFSILYVGESLNPLELAARARLRNSLDPTAPPTTPATGSCPPNSNPVYTTCIGDSVQTCYKGNPVGTPRACSGNTPICSSGSCVAKESFSCAIDGYFPDPDRCEKFHLCLGGEKVTTDCSQIVPKAVYDPKLRSCVAGIGKPCYKFNAACKNKMLATYPGDGNIFAVCLDNAVFQMYTCPEGTVFDEAKQGCSVQCTKEGRVADPDSNNKFIMCISTGFNKYLAYSGTCPSGAIYDKTSNQCVLGSTSAPTTTPEQL